MSNFSQNFIVLTQTYALAVGRCLVLHLGNKGHPTVHVSLNIFLYLLEIDLPVESPRSRGTHHAKVMRSAWTYLPHLVITQQASRQNTGIIQAKLMREASSRLN